MQHRAAALELFLVMAVLAELTAGLGQAEGFRRSGAVVAGVTAGFGYRRVDTPLEKAAQVT